MLSIPVVINHEVVGSLSLHSYSPAGFDESSRSVGTLLATRVASALTKSEVPRAGRDLVGVVQEHAAESEVMAQAQGVLMELYDCSSQQAVAWIDQVSRANAEARGQAMIGAKSATGSGVAGEGTEFAAFDLSGQGEDVAAL